MIIQSFGLEIRKLGSMSDLYKEGVGIDGLVPEKVNDYIKEKGLYGYKR